MFFAPTLRQLSKQYGNRINVLCLTNGDFYGQGHRRSNELEKSCSVLIPDGKLKNLEVVNEPEKLPDSPKDAWDLPLCKSLIQKYVDKHSVDLVVSFDERGVSGHANHCQIGKLLKEMKQNGGLNAGVELFLLNTVEFLRKYSTVADLLPTLVGLYFRNESSLVMVNSLSDYMVAFAAMLEHKSQLVWFRWIYILISRYMIVNCLTKY
jgi:N-acetylglucosaminylphosphatidylinositol deacetylase